MCCIASRPGIRRPVCALPASACCASKRTWRTTLRPLLTVGRLLALALLIIGLARPQLAQAKEIVHGEGVDIVIAQDISGSMAALDFQPQNRLEAAKAVVDDFISRRTYDRIGLVVFAHEAFSQSPMTTDHAVLNRLLKQVQARARSANWKTARPSAWVWRMRPTCSRILKRKAAW